MKIKIILLLLVTACYSCGTKKPVSTAEKNKIMEQVKEVIVIINKAAEEVNFGLMEQMWLDSPDFIYHVNGKIYRYTEFTDRTKAYFNTLTGQHGTVLNEKFIVVDKSTVIYSASYRWVANFKDGHAVLSDPWAEYYMLRNTDKKWRIVSGVESGIAQNVKNTETPDPLNQVELHKKLVGFWRSVEGKDTLATWDVKPLGNGLEIHFKYTNKNKTILEGNQIFAFNEKSDIFIVLHMVNGKENVVNATRFTTENRCEMLPLNDMLYPESAPLKWIFDFKSDHEFLVSQVVNNKTIKVTAYKKIR